MSNPLVFLFGKPTASKLERIGRGFLAGVGSSAIYGLIDWAAQLYASVQTGGAFVINWHLIQRTVLITLFPTLIGWATALAVYLRKIESETKILSVEETQTTTTTTVKLNDEAS